MEEGRAGFSCPGLLPGGPAVGDVLSGEGAVGVEVEEGVAEIAFVLVDAAPPVGGDGAAAEIGDVVVVDAVDEVGVAGESEADVGVFGEEVFEFAEVSVLYGGGDDGVATFGAVAAGGGSG